MTEARRKSLIYLTQSRSCSSRSARVIDGSFSSDTLFTAAQMTNEKREAAKHTHRPPFLCRWAPGALELNTGVAYWSISGLFDNWCASHLTTLCWGEVVSRGLMKLLSHRKGKGRCGIGLDRCCFFGYINLANSCQRFITRTHHTHTCAYTSLNS